MEQDKDRKPADETEDTEGNVFTGGPTVDREPSPTGDENREKNEDPREGIIPKRIIPKR